MSLESSTRWRDAFYYLCGACQIILEALVEMYTLLFTNTPDSVEKAPICESEEEVVEKSPLPWTTSMCDACSLAGCYQQPSTSNSSESSPDFFSSDFKCCVPQTMINDSIYDPELTNYPGEVNSDGVWKSIDNQT